MTDPLIIPIRGPKIYYLDSKHLSLHLDVTLVSQNGEKLQVNKLQLAAFSQNMFDPADFEEDAVIATNLDLKDLQLVADFITEGLLPMPEKDLKLSIPSEIATVFSSFGISLSSILNNVVQDQVKNEPLAHVKTELEDIKLEDGDVIFDLPGLDDIDDIIEEDQKPLKKETTRKRGRRKKEAVPAPSEDEDDGDWTPEIHHRPKRRSAAKLNSDATISNIDQDAFDDFEDEQADDLLVQKPKQKRKPRKQRSMSNGLSRQEKDLITQCEKFLEKYPNFANLTIPSEDNPESKAYENFVIPSGDLETYKSQPKKCSEKLRNSQDVTHPYPCPQCPAWFSNPYAIKSHELLCHSEHYQCNQCKHISPLNQPEEFKQHLFKHEVRKHECIRCGFTNATLKSLEAHIKAEGPFHNNKCFSCPSTFGSHQDFKQHVQSSHQNVWLYVCGQCDIHFENQALQKEHRNKEHKVTKPQANSQLKICDLCGKEVTSMTTHYRVHHEECPVKCPECPKICKTKYHLDDHIKGTHSRIPCEHCGLMIPMRRKERHIQQAHVHPDDRKYKCDHCGKGFTDRQKLNDHINTHTGERPYICTYCGKGFANHGNQRAHIRQAHLGQKRNYRK